jgi:hypothetical protein
MITSNRRQPGEQALEEICGVAHPAHRFLAANV